MISFNSNLMWKKSKTGPLFAWYCEICILWPQQGDDSVCFWREVKKEVKHQVLPLKILTLSQLKLRIAQGPEGSEGPQKGQ